MGEKSKYLVRKDGTATCSLRADRESARVLKPVLLRGNRFFHLGVLE
jgi:hypothetical protein